MRSLRYSCFAMAALLAMAAPSSAPAQDLYTADTTITGIAPDLERAPESAPTPDRPDMPIEVVGLGAALATARTRRGKRGDVPMYLDSHVHVMREDKKGDPVLKRIRGGILIDDTDLTDEEVDELTARKVVRPASQEEVERLAQSGTEAERTDLLREQEEEMAKLTAKHEMERAELGDGASASKRQKLEERQAKELTALQGKHAKALNALGE